MPREPIRRKRGRPPEPREKVRRNRVVTFLTDSEFEILQEMVDLKETTLSQECYQMIKKALERNSGT